MRIVFSFPTAVWGGVMGCTPSIHVNQTGVVYCRDSDESNSPGASYSAAYHTQITRSEATEMTSGTRSGSTSKGKKKDKGIEDKGLYIQNVNEAETQTSRLNMKVIYFS